MRRTKASLIYKRTEILRAVQILLGHTKLESTIRYLGIEVDDALKLAGHTEIWVILVMQMQGFIFLVNARFGHKHDWYHVV